MIITDAYWEKRNLGVDTVEIQVEDSDELSEIVQKMNGIRTTYCVAKIPSDRMDVVREVQRMGYTYMEDLILVCHDLHEVARSALYQRLYDATSYRRMDEEDVKRLLCEIDNGMFGNDRISNDAAFSREQAAKRYRNWVMDLLNQGAIPYAMLYKGDPSGFVILKEQQRGIYDSVLGGAYEKYRKSGLGIVQKEQEIVRNLGGKAVETRVSSNNLNQVKALILNGYIPKKIDHVFGKHFDK